MIVTTLALVGELASHALRDVGEAVVTAVRDVATGLAAEPTPEPNGTINTDGVVEFIATKIAPILLAVLGVIFISRAGKGEMSRVLTSSAIAIIGLAFIAGAGALFLFGEGLIDLIFGVGTMRLRTDDDIYRARLVYLGPPGYTLPVQLPYAQYGLFLLLVPLYMFIHYLITQDVDPFPAWEIALAMVTTSFIWRYVDPDQPARTVIRTALTDWRRTRVTADEQRLPRLVARRITVREKIL